MPHPTTCPQRAPASHRLALAGLAVAAALTGAAAPAVAADSPGRSLAQRQGCLGCHAVDAAIVGPAYKAIAERYAGQPEAAAEVVRRIREGGGGRWGPMPMPPQGQLSEGQARQLASWILSGAR